MATSSSASTRPLVDLFGEDVNHPGFPKSQHDFYFETPSNIPFRKASETVATEGILSSSWKSERLDRLEIGECGAYFAWELTDRPHCQQPRSQRMFISKCAKERGISAVNSIPYSKPYHIDVGNLVVFNGHSPEFQEAVKPHLDGLSLDDMKKELMDHNHRRPSGATSDRGNKNTYAGFAAQNQKLDNDFGMTAPQIVSGTNRVEVCRMIALSSIMRTLSEMAGFECPFTNDANRSKRFSQYLVEEFGLEGVNLIEHKSAALTSAYDSSKSVAARLLEQFMVGAHLDKLNCRLRNWNIVFTLYFHFFDPQEQCWFRVAQINCSRACANSFLVRLNSADFLFNNLVLYYNSSTNASRRDIDDPLLLLPPTKEDGTVSHIHSPPIFDKAMGFLSSFTTIVYHASKLGNMTLERICELVLPIMWLTTPTNYYVIFDEWIRYDNLPTGNVTVAFMETMVQKFSGINAGSGSRYTPSFTFSITEEDLFQSLRILRQVILDVNRNSDKSMTRRETLKALTQIIGVRDLGAQHALTVLTMSGIMKIKGDINPALANVCKGTLTFGKITKVFGLSEVVTNSTYSRVADATGTATGVVENVGCEYIREAAEELLMAKFDETHHKKKLDERGLQKPDTYFSNQMMFATSAEGPVTVYSTCQEPFMVSYMSLPSGGKGITWLEQSGRTKVEIKVSTTSRLRSAATSKKEKNKGRMKKLPKPMAIGVLPSRFRKIKENNEQVRRSYEEDEDPELAFEMKVSKEEKFRLGLGTKRMMRNSTSLQIETIMSATRRESTYQYLDVRSTSLSILTHQTQRKKRKRAQQYFKTHSQFFDDYCETLFTAEVRYDVHVYLSCMAGKSIVPPLGYVRYHKGKAYYRSRRLALHALYINILVREAGKRDKGEDSRCGDPMWSQNVLPKTRMYKPNDFVVLYEKRHPSDVLLGCLFFKGDKRILSVPTDSNDLSAPWYSYTLNNFVTI